MLFSARRSVCPLASAQQAIPQANLGIPQANLLLSYCSQLITQATDRCREPASYEYMFVQASEGNLRCLANLSCSCNQVLVSLLQPVLGCRIESLATASGNGADLLLPKAVSQLQLSRRVDCLAAAAEFREVMGKDGIMKKVRRKVKPVADGTPLAKKVEAQSAVLLDSM